MHGTSHGSSNKSLWLLLETGINKFKKAIRDREDGDVAQFHLLTTGNVMSIIKQNWTPADVDETTTAHASPSSLIAPLSESIATEADSNVEQCRRRSVASVARSSSPPSSDIRK